jgi:hypothetical protein
VLTQAETKELLVQGRPEAGATGRVEIFREKAY